MISEHECDDHSVRSELTIESDGRRQFRVFCTECGKVLEQRRLYDSRATPARGADLLPGDVDPDQAMVGG